MSVRHRLIAGIKTHPIDSAALLASLIAVSLSAITLLREKHEHSDILTAQVIREAYSDFLQLNDLRGQYPLQSHVFETPENYTRNKRLVITACGPMLSDSDLARLMLQEAALAERIMTMFEHSYYQWKHARETADPARIDFLKAVLDYFTGRILTNPRLLWYWSRAGANLEQHFEPETIAYYNQHVAPIGRASDSVGPFVATAPPSSPNR